MPGQAILNLDAGFPSRPRRTGADIVFPTSWREGGVASEM
jgi:hypothetical protein